MIFGKKKVYLRIYLWGRLPLRKVITTISGGTPNLKGTTPPNPEDTKRARSCS